VAFIESIWPTCDKISLSYLFVDHPALDGPEMQAFYRIRYENVAADRQGVVDTWTSPLVPEAIKRKNIKLISYADLIKH